VSESKLVALIGAGVMKMVIMNIIDEKDKQRLPDIDKSSNPYVYLVDNEQQMMLILKRDLNEISGNDSADEFPSIQEFISEKVHRLLDRINVNGPLSLREMEVLNYAALGKSNKQIAEIIGLSESTIKNHFSSTLRKLHANDRTHAVTLALCNGWLSIKNISNILGDEGTVIKATGEY
jgi:DNA-binding CsgD family transcriptional regulator